MQREPKRTEKERREERQRHSENLIAHAERTARGHRSCRDPIPIAEDYTRERVQEQQAKEARAEKGDPDAA